MVLFCCLSVSYMDTKLLPYVGDLGALLINLSFFGDIETSFINTQLFSSTFFNLKPCMHAVKNVAFGFLHNKAFTYLCLDCVILKFYHKKVGINDYFFLWLIFLWVNSKYFSLETRYVNRILLKYMLIPCACHVFVFWFLSFYFCFVCHL